MNTRDHLSLPPPGHRTGEGSESLLPYLLQLVAAKPGGGASPADGGRTGSKPRPQRSRRSR